MTVVLLDTQGPPRGHLCGEDSAPHQREPLPESSSVSSAMHFPSWLANVPSCCPRSPPAGPVPALTLWTRKLTIKLSGAEHKVGPEGFLLQINWVFISTTVWTQVSLIVSWAGTVRFQTLCPK